MARPGKPLPLPAPLPRAEEERTVTSKLINHAAPAHTPGHPLDRIPVSPCPCARGIPVLQNCRARLRCLTPLLRIPQGTLSTGSRSHLVHAPAAYLVLQNCRARLRCLTPLLRIPQGILSTGSRSHLVHAPAAYRYSRIAVRVGKASRRSCASMRPRHTGTRVAVRLEQPFHRSRPPAQSMRPRHTGTRVAVRVGKALRRSCAYPRAPSRPVPGLTLSMRPRHTGTQSCRASWKSLTPLLRIHAPAAYRY